MLAPVDDVGGLELRQTLEPEAGRLGLTVTELPRLDDLVGLAPLGRHDAHRVLDGDLGDVSVGELHEEVDGLLLSPVRALGCEPARSADSEVSAGWERNHHVPPVVDDVEHRTLVVRARHIGREQVTGHGVVSHGPERIADCAAVFACNEYAHHRLHPSSPMWWS